MAKKNKEAHHSHKITSFFSAQSSLDDSGVEPHPRPSKRRKADAAAVSPSITTTAAFPATSASSTTSTSSASFHTATSTSATNSSATTDSSAVAISQAVTASLTVATITTVATAHAAAALSASSTAADLSLSSTVAAGAALPVAVFAPKDNYPCPFVSIGYCEHASTSYGNYNDLVRHVKAVHHLYVPPPPALRASPLEDGTQKIACPNACGAYFDRYLLAGVHASKECPASPPTDIPCPWAEYTGCTDVFDSRKAAKDHSYKHRQDTRSPYRCQGCSKFYANLYALAMHETACSSIKAPLKVSSATMRFDLTTGSYSTPLVLIAARSSTHPPNEWKAGTNSLIDGLPIWGRRILSQYELFTGQHDTKAVLHVTYEVLSKDLPAMPQYQPDKEQPYGQRRSYKRAKLFTDAIEKDILLAGKTGVVPTIVAVGLDGWACHTPKILEYLSSRKMHFNLVLRLPSDVKYGFETQFAKKSGGFYWAIYDSSKILNQLEDEEDDAATENLIMAWDDIQGRKLHRAQHQLWPGRNSSINRTG